MINNEWYKIFQKKNNPYLNKSINIIKNKKDKNYKTLSFELSKIVYGSDKFFFYDFITFLSKKIKFLYKKKKISIGEYGSGNGFILYYFSKKYKINNIFSFEISKDYLSFQKKLIGFGKFISVRPKNYKIKIKDSSVDIFIISSLFQYLPSYKQAKKLINECIRVSVHRILILDIYNDLTKENYNLKKMRESELSQIQFKKKYNNLPYRFYKKNFFNYINKNKKVKKFFFIKMPKTWKYRKYSFCVIIDLKQN
jgi:ubiquinone/menaquinone biosynthesis C-methylase UbiE